jgi:hypothetical protein
MKLEGLLFYWFIIESPERNCEACCFTGFLLSLLNEAGRLAVLLVYY